MSAGVGDQKLLEPISVDRPCGESLEDTPLLASFDALRLFGQSRSPEAPPEPEDRDKEKEKAKPVPEWDRIKTDAIEGLARSKDLRLLTYLGTALLRTDGLPAFFETLTVASRWLEAYWHDVYPLVDEDAVARRNALNCFADPMAVVDRVWRTPLVASRQHGRFSLRDIDMAAGQAPVGATETRPDEKPINAAFGEMPLDELSALERGVTSAVAALNGIDAKMREQGPEVVPDFDPLSAQLAKMRRVLRAHLASRPGNGGPDVAGPAGELPAEVFAGGVIRSRQDAIRALEAVSDFFRRNEPSSPIPLLLERAKRLVSKDFLEVLAEIAPEALSVARAAGGLRETE